MKVAAIIPARYRSIRFPGKPLVKILGKPMIQWVYEAVCAAAVFNEVWVATDHDDICACVKSFGGNVAVTQPSHQTGTDRIWEVARGLDVDAVVNVQGDEPLVAPMLLGKICKELELLETVVTAGFVSYDRESFYSKDHVKVVVDEAGFALYFSRAAIPFSRELPFTNFLHHVGVYGYPMSVLREFVGRPKGKLETQECLEQLRLLENGFKIKVLTTDYKGFGVDRPEDVFFVESALRASTFLGQ